MFVYILFSSLGLQMLDLYSGMLIVVVDVAFFRCAFLQYSLIFEQKLFALAIASIRKKNEIMNL